MWYIYNTLTSLTMCSDITRFDLGNFGNIRDEGFDYTLPGSVLDIVRIIAEQVGSPSYIKTPSFPKRHRKEKRIPYPTTPPVSKFINITSDYDKIKHDIKLLINKLTDNTYDSIVPKICDLVESISSSTADVEDVSGNNGVHSLDKEEPSQEFLQNMESIGGIMFELASSNAFYSVMYAKLYKELMTRFDIFESVLESKLMEYNGCFQNIEYISPEKDYDEFCNNNIKNDKRRALSKFTACLLNEDVIHDEFVFQILRDLHKQLFVNIDDAESSHICDEICENVKIITITSYYLLNKSSHWSELQDTISRVQNMNPKEHAGFTSKSKFRYCDIQDFIKKQNIKQ